MRERPSVVSVCKCNSSNSMSFLDIKDPAKRMALVDEYVKAMKTVRRRNMVNREACDWGGAADPLPSN